MKDGGHLVRVAGLFAAGVLLFLLLRAVFVPEDFGKYGHYRAGALADNASRPIAFAGKPACLDCHSDVQDAQKGSKHARLSCETCHGPLARHAADPEKLTPAKLVATTLCLGCHRTNAARPEKFPQVDPKDHSEGAACESCHKPHHPEPEGA